MPIRDHIVLVHGLWRTPLSLAIPRRRLRAAGYRAVGIHYPSFARPIEELARFVARRLPTNPTGRLHFLTHSLGGLVVRYLIRTERPANLGRVVMLGPPNHGSELARRLTRHRVFATAAGPAGQQLASPQEVVDGLLGPVDFDLGVIIGDKSMPLTSRHIRGTNDGVVGVDEARIEGMKDFLVVHCRHTFIMNDAHVVKQAVHFFERGSFSRATDGPDGVSGATMQDSRRDP
jgi:pimeloyl-ACP methyl ester carboxylesterase